MQQHYYQQPVYLIPKMNTHAIIDPMVSANLPILFPVAQPINQLKVKKASSKN